MTAPNSNKIPIPSDTSLGTKLQRANFFTSTQESACNNSFISIHVIHCSFSLGLFLGTITDNGHEQIFEWRHGASNSSISSVDALGLAGLRLLQAV